MCHAGPMAQTVCVIVSAADRERLQAIVGDRNRPRKHVERARIVLASAEPEPAQRVAVRVTFPEEILKQVPLRSGLSVVATIHTRDPATPEPTLLGALGLEAFATRSLKP